MDGLRVCVGSVPSCLHPPLPASNTHTPTTAKEHGHNLKQCDNRISFQPRIACAVMGVFALCELTVYKFNRLNGAVDSNQRRRARAVESGTTGATLVTST